MSRLPALFIAILPALVLSAQDSGSLREFTDKKGEKKVLATLLRVSEDNRFMRIRLEDGQEATTEINVLSLDDQQFIKDWIKTAKLASDFRLEIDIEKKAGRTERFNGSSSSYEYEKRLASYEVKVRNLSRESLPPTRLEYTIIWNNRLATRLSDDGGWSYSSLTDEDDPINLVKITGEASLAALPFNRDEVVPTGEIEIDRMFISRDLYREDELYGIIARVVTTEGNVVAEKRIGNSRLDAIEWKEVSEIKELPKDD